MCTVYPARRGSAPGEQLRGPGVGLAGMLFGFGLSGSANGG